MSVSYLLREAEKYTYPIIITKESGIIVRNAACLSVRTLRRAEPLKRMLKSERSKLEALSNREICIVSFNKASKERRALVIRISDCYIFMYLPMLEKLSHIPTDFLGADKWVGTGLSDALLTECTMPRMISFAAVKIIGRREIRMSSFARVCSICATLAFSEDVVSATYDTDDLIDSAEAFNAFGWALEGFDSASAAELASFGIDIALKNRVLSVSLYGIELYCGKALAISAVAPYSYAGNEQATAFALAVICELMRGRE